MNRPYIPFGVLALVTLMVLFLEYQTLHNQVLGILTGRDNHRAKQEELDQRTEKLKNLRADLPPYQEAFEHLFGAYTDTPLDPSQFTALYALNPSIRVLDAGKKAGTQAAATSGARPSTSQLAWTYDFSSTAVEFHRFLPALAETENALPLMRFTKLAMVSPQEPFFADATPLNITGTFTTVREGAIPPARPLK